MRARRGHLCCNSRLFRARPAMGWRASRHTACRRRRAAARYRAADRLVPRAWRPASGARPHRGRSGRDRRDAPVPTAAAPSGLAGMAAVRPARRRAAAAPAAVGSTRGHSRLAARARRRAGSRIPATQLTKFERVRDPAGLIGEGPALARAGGASRPGARPARNAPRRALAGRGGAAFMTTAIWRSSSRHFLAPRGRCGRPSCARSCCPSAVPTMHRSCRSSGSAVDRRPGMARGHLGGCLLPGAAGAALTCSARRRAIQRRFRCHRPAGPVPGTTASASGSSGRTCPGRGMGDRPPGGGRPAPGRR